MRATKPGWWVLAVCSVAVAVSACKGGEEEGGECVDDRTFFSQQVWNTMKAKDCVGCHNPGGEGRNSKFILQQETVSGWQDANMTMMRDVAAFERDGVSLLLLKPSGQVAHEGGALLPPGSPEYEALEEMVARFKDPVSCGEQTRTEEHFDGVVLMTPEETLRKATLNLVGRLPTAAEEFRVATGGVEALDVEVDRLMLEDGFYSRLEQIWNDQFLVERYVGRDNAVDLLDEDFYPNGRWYVPDDERDFSGENQEFLEAARMYTNDAVARAPLKLASYIVRNNLPFTEIVTADYMVVNPYSARAYGITGIQWEDPLDPEEWKAGKIPNHPHAGVMTDPMWLNRFPTTDTNRNRHRARMVFWFFLATDVLKLAERPLDIATVSEHNPTVNNPNCSVCHAPMDPVAGMLQNWDAQGNYNPREEGWYQEMPQPGFDNWTMPAAATATATQQLAQKIAADRRFATAMVQHIYRGLTGLEPLSYPGDSTHPDFQSDLLQYEIQSRVFDDIAQLFIDTNYNLKAIFKELIKSPYFRAKDHTSEDPAVLASVGEVGQGRLLTPELLDKKIVAVTGMRWADNNGEPYLLDPNDYLILYGGIDSDDVTIRIGDPNGIMSGIQYRMANEMACQTVARDFTQAPEKRRYFPFVEPAYMPRDNSGFDVAEAQSAIRKNIKYLHWHVLGERLDADDPQLQATYDLFVQTWDELKAAGVDPNLQNCAARNDFNGAELPEEQRIDADPDFTIRAWMAVITYMLSDYNFLYE